MKRIRFILCSVFMFFMVNLCCGSSYAAVQSDFEPDRSCSLTFNLFLPGSEKIYVSGAEITIYQVADISVEGENVKYSFTDDFKDCAVSLLEDSIYDEKIAAEVYQYAVTHSLKGISLVTGDDGKVKFEGLKTGVYLCSETKSPTKFSEFVPFILSLPEADENVWDYDVVAAPKIEAKRVYEATVNKIWNDDGKNRPESITVELYNGDDIYDSVVLSATNNWTYTWDSLPYGEEWSVREKDIPKGYTVTYTNNGTVFNIINTKSLIQTGQLKWPVPILGCIGLGLAIAGVAVMRSGRKRENDQ